MELIDLRYFVEIARYGSFTKTAKHLYISQPTLSRRIKALEDELGAQLFVRDLYHVRLTDKGETLLPEAQQIVARCDRLAALLVDGDPAAGDIRTAGTVHVAHQLQIDDSGMLAAVRRLAASHPAIQVDLSNEPISEIVVGLQRGRFDAGFYVANAFFTAEGIETRTVAKGEMLMLAPPNSPFCGRSTVNAVELRGVKMVLFEREISPLYYDFLMSQFIGKGFMLTPACHVRDEAAVIQMVAAGRGVGFMHSLSSLRGALEERNIEAVRIDGVDLEYDYVIAWRSDDNSPALHAFLEEVAGQAPL